MLVVLAVFVATAVPLAQQPPKPAALRLELARVVDLPTPATRQAGVAALLELSRDLDAWLEACRAFGSFEQLEQGPMRESVALQVLDVVEPTEVHLYVPPGYDPAKPAPLLLWGHGQGGDGAGQYRLWQPVADQLGMLVLAPTEPAAVRGYSKEPRERAATLLALRWARRRANIDENAIFVGGWSRGGHLAWDLALRHPDLFAGMLACVGGPLIEPGPTNNMRYLENVAALPIRDLQGSQDDPKLLRNLRLAFQKLKKFRAADAQFVEFADRGHDADLAAVDWAKFFGKRREPWPKTVVRVAAQASEARAAWLEITGFTDKVAVDAMPEVAAARWQRMNDEQKVAYLLDALADYTARLEVTDKGQGQFTADGRGVTRFTLRLAEDQLGKDGKVEVKLQRRPIRKTVKADAEVLLRDFVERFDRTRLPVARVDVP